MENRKLIYDLMEEGTTEPKLISKELNIPLSTTYRVMKNINEGKGIKHQKGGAENFG